MRRNRSFLSLVLCALTNTPKQQAGAVKAYIGYGDDSTCVNDDTITGTYTLSYDDDTYSLFGISTEYEGDCMYFEDGYLDLSQLGYDVDASDYILFGLCSVCNGVAGCSYNGTCGYTQAVDSNAYENAQSSGDESSNSDAIDSSAVQQYLMSFSDSVTQMISSEVAQSQVQADAVGSYYMFGGVACVATILGLLYSAEKRRARKMAESFRENLHDETHSVTNQCNAVNVTHCGAVRV